MDARAPRFDSNTRDSFVPASTPGSFTPRWLQYKVPAIPVAKNNTMRVLRIAPTVAAIALGACGEASGLLNSERIEAQFGSYGIDVISHRDGLRRASLYSTHDSGKVTRTYAIVHFDDVPEVLLDEEHARILAGASIGATFKSAGWWIRKETLYIGSLDPGADVHGIRRMMQLSDAPALAMHVYRLHIKKEKQSIEYATIIELHHPDYMTPGRLQAIYGDGKPARADGALREHWESLILDRRHDVHGAD